MSTWDDVDALLAHLDDCYIEVWRTTPSKTPGHTTLIDWEPLTKTDGKVLLYLSHLITYLGIGVKHIVDRMETDARTASEDFLKYEEVVKAG